MSLAHGGTIYSACAGHLLVGTHKQAHILSHKHSTHTHLQNLSNTHTLSHAHMLSPTHNANTHIQAHTLSHTHIHIHIDKHSLSLSLKDTHTHILLSPCIYTCSHEDMTSTHTCQFLKYHALSVVGEIWCMPVCEFLRTCVCVPCAVCVCAVCSCSVSHVSSSW